MSDCREGRVDDAAAPVGSEHKDEGDVGAPVDAEEGAAELLRSKHTRREGSSIGGRVSS